MLSSSGLDFGTGCLLIFPVNSDIDVGQSEQNPDSEIGKVSESICNPLDDFDFIVGPLDWTIRVGFVLETMENLFLVLAGASLHLLQGLGIEDRSWTVIRRFTEILLLAH